MILTISHMRKANVSDLRYRFQRIEACLNQGEEIAIYKRQKLIGVLMPVSQIEPYPDFAELRRRIFGSRKARKTGTELVSEARGPF